MAPTLHRFAGRCPPWGREFSLGRPGAEFHAPTLHRCAGRCPPRGRVSAWATLNKSPWMHAPGCEMGCKAQTTAIPVGIARICNAADRPQPGCVRHVGLIQRCPWGGPALKPHAPTLRRCAGRCPPRGRVSAWGGPALKPHAPTLHRCTGRCPPRGRVSAWATLNKSPWMHAPGCEMGCKAQTTAIPGGIARICNAADRPQPGCVRHAGLIQRCPWGGPALKPHAPHTEHPSSPSPPRTRGSMAGFQEVLSVVVASRVRGSDEATVNFTLWP